MSRWVMVAGVAGIAAIAIIGIWLLGSNTDPETATVERGSIDVTIETIGTIQVDNPQPVRTTVGGIVEAIGAEVGDHIVAGDIVVLLDDEPLRAAVEEAKAALEAAEFALQFAEQRLAKEPDSLDLQQEVLEDAERVRLADELLAHARNQQRSGAILADSSGIVLELLVGPGDRVGENQPVAQLYSQTDLVLIADIDELDLPNVTAGATVRFRLDSFPASELEGNVIKTAPQASVRGGATLFPAEIAFNVPADLDIRPGMNADVTVVTDLRNDVLLVPERALRTVGQRAFVLLEQDGDVNEVEVIIGYRANGMAEIVSGLSEGDSVQLR